MAVIYCLYISQFSKLRALWTNIRAYFRAKWRLLFIYCRGLDLGYLSKNALFLELKLKVLPNSQASVKWPHLDPSFSWPSWSGHAVPCGNLLRFHSPVRLTGSPSNGLLQVETFHKLILSRLLERPTFSCVARFLALARVLSCVSRRSCSK